MFLSSTFDFFLCNKFAVNITQSTRENQTFSKKYCKTIPITKLNNLPILYMASGNDLAHNIHAHVSSAQSTDVLAFEMDKVIPKYNLQPELESDELDDEFMATTPQYQSLTDPLQQKKHISVQCTNKTCANCNKIAIDDSGNKINMKDLQNLS